MLSMSKDMPVFNVRVYGILINLHKQVLVTDEFRFGQHMTKFPGGGLRFGEGTIDCVKREFKEELNCDIRVVKHFYTIDYFQPSAFNVRQQLISIYYIVDGNPIFEEQIKPTSEGEQLFRWVLLSEISPEQFTFPVDKKVAEMLKNYKD